MRTTSNFKKFQERSVDDTVRLKIRPALERIGKRRGREPIRKLTHLAVELQTITGIHRTTLTRNMRYVEELTRFLETQPGAVGTLSDDGASPDLLIAKLRVARGEIANLRHVVAVLQSRLARLDLSKPAGVEPRTDDHGLITADTEDDLNRNIPFQDTAHLVLMLVEHLNNAVKLPAGIERLSIDVEAKEIRDNSLRPEKQRIVGTERGSWLFRWMTANRRFLSKR